MKPALVLPSFCALIGAVTPASAQSNSYGGYDIVTFPGAETFYAAARNWNVFKAHSQNGLAYCFAETVRKDGAAFRIGYDGMQWQLAVPVTSYPDWQGVLQIDGAGSGRGYMSGGDTISGTAMRGWTIAWLGLAELDGLQKGQTAVLGVGGADFDFSLAGSTAAILKVEECVTLGGVAPAEAAVAVTSEPGEAYSIPFSAAGDWVINEIRDGQAVLACEIVKPSWPYLRFEIDRDNSYVDFRDGGPMHDLGTRIGVDLSFGPGDGPYPYIADMIEGRDGEAWARITEGRMDGPGLMDDWLQNAVQVTFQARGVLLEADLSGSKQAFDTFFRCSNAIN